MQFDDRHIQIASVAFAQAESLVNKRFRLGWEEMKRHRYEVKTLAQLTEQERDSQVFAHLCRYELVSPQGARGSHFYRICLQDDRILEAVSRAGSGFSLAALLLYIATHELVHVIRFDRSGADFNARGEEKQKEEERVHNLTCEILSCYSSREMRIVRDCFSPRYLI